MIKFELTTFYQDFLFLYRLSLADGLLMAIPRLVLLGTVVYTFESVC